MSAERVYYGDRGASYIASTRRRGPIERMELEGLRERQRAMTRAGKSMADIALALGVTDRTVQRWIDRDREEVRNGELRGK